MKLGASRRAAPSRQEAREEEDLPAAGRTRGLTGTASPSPLVLLACRASPMQPIEIALFGAVVALAAGLIGYILWPFARAPAGRDGTRRAAAGAPSAGVAAADAPAPCLVCPACQREYDAGAAVLPARCPRAGRRRRSGRARAPRPA